MIISNSITNVIQTNSNYFFHLLNIKYVGDRNDFGQSGMHVYDKKTGIIFYTMIGLNGIGCWNTALPLNPSNLHIIAQDNKTMIFPSDINVSQMSVILQIIVHKNNCTRPEIELNF